jgi:hypothetical protein
MLLNKTKNVRVRKIVMRSRNHYFNVKNRFSMYCFNSIIRHSFKYFRKNVI